MDLPDPTGYHAASSPPLVAILDLIVPFAAVILFGVWQLWVLRRDARDPHAQAARDALETLDARETQDARGAHDAAPGDSASRSARLDAGR